MSKRLVVKVGEYEKDGQKKGEYVNVGVMLDGEHGPYLLLDPAVSLSGLMMKQRILNKKGEKVLVSIYDNDNQQSGGGQGKKDFDDDIPF